MIKFLYTLTLLLAISACQSTETRSSDDTARPNIIFILADDLGYGDLPTYGQQKLKTPNIDRIAKNGMTFIQHYSGSTVCAPSRSSLLTGLHTGHTFIRGNKEVRPEGQHPIPDSVRTIAEVLKEAGYVTGAFGKWGLGFPGSEGAPEHQGFDEFFGYNCQRIAHHYYPYHLWRNDEKVVLSENEGTKTGTYAPSLIHEEALAFIDEHKDTNFFLYYPSLIPHAELIAPEKVMAKFRGKFDPEKTYEGVDGGERFRNGPYGSQPESHAAFAAMVALLDQQVGEILDKIEELGLSNNTLIIFTSDNGPHLEGGADPDFFDSNGPFKGYKRDLYEGGIRVPMLAQWKDKIEPGAISQHISAFWDFFPTACEVAQVDIPKALDGISYLPTLLGQGQPQHEFLYWEFHEKGGRLAVRKGPWKAVVYNVLKDSTGAVELYNLDNDAGESRNVAALHPRIVAEMVEIMKSAHQPSDAFPFAMPDSLR